MKLARTTIAALAALVGLLGASAAFAEGETDVQAQDRLSAANYARGGYYIGFEGLAAIENSPAIGFLNPNTHFVSGGLDIRLGYRHNRWLASEIYGTYIHTYGDGTGQYLAWGMSANERFYFTRSRIQPYITAGIGFLQVSSRQPAFVAPGGTSGFDPGFFALFGAGIEFYASENVVFTLMANYHLTVGKIQDFQYISTGIGMQFF